jgi:tRNA(fMet)-specific endonuclease VapC
LNGYLLDTNILSDLIRNPSGSAARQVERVGAKTIFTSIIVAAELRYGCAKKGSARLLAAVENLLEIIPALPLDAPSDAEYGRIRAALEAAGEVIGQNDLLIGAHARALGLTLVTDNTKEFKRIRGLEVENWLGK